MPDRNFIKDVLWGVAIGDAIGVPVEFLSRSEMKKNPLTGMSGYGTHEQPPGTWSDDSSLTFCLAEMLCGEYDLKNLAKRFVNWKEYAYWTPHGEVFDIGITTSSAIYRLATGTPPVLAGDGGEGSNGNGSLMRILPLLFYIRNKKVEERFLITKDISSLTHSHIRSVISCFIYLEIALEIIKGSDKLDAYLKTCSAVSTFLLKTDICTRTELEVFRRILSGDIAELKEEEIHSSGYVIHTLEATLWSVLKTDTYTEAVLKAVNLGSDTDTTGAVAGGLAGLIYGWQNIPDDWVAAMVKKNEIDDLADRLYAKTYL